AVSQKWAASFAMGGLNLRMPHSHSPLRWLTSSLASRLTASFNLNAGAATAGGSGNCTGRGRHVAHAQSSGARSIVWVTARLTARGSVWLGSVTFPTALNLICHSDAMGASAPATLS